LQRHVAGLSSSVQRKFVNGNPGRDLRMKTTLFAMLAVLSLAYLPGTARAGGAELFDKKCAGCHGKDAKAGTTMGKKLNMRDLTNPKVQQDSTDAMWEKLILEGVKGAGGKNVMPATKITPEEAKEVIKFVRTLKK
jgi:mono/diheme cytochrome c family protein